MMSPLSVSSAQLTESISGTPQSNGPNLPLAVFTVFTPLKT